MQSDAICGVYDILDLTEVCNRSGACVLRLNKVSFSFPTLTSESLIGCVGWKLIRKGDGARDLRFKFSLDGIYRKNLARKIE